MSDQEHKEFEAWAKSVLTCSEHARAEVMAYSWLAFTAGRAALAQQAVPEGADLLQKAGEKVAAMSDDEFAKAMARCADHPLAAAPAAPECTRSHPHEDMGEACQRKTEEARAVSAARQASRPLCRDCADFGPICPNSGRPCGGTDAAPRAEQRAGQAPAEGDRADPNAPSDLDTLAAALMNNVPLNTEQRSQLWLLVDSKRQPKGTESDALPHYTPAGRVPKPFFSYSPDNGVEFYATAGEAQEATRIDIAEYRKDAQFNGEWPDEVEHCYWGEVKGRAEATEPNDEGGIDYRLSAVQAPAPGAELADERAAFEASHELEYPAASFRRNIDKLGDGNYLCGLTQSAWEGWKARAARAPAVGDEPAQAFLCRAWGESDLPAAELVPDWDGVRAFMVREWTGSEDATADDGTNYLDELKEEFDRHEEDERGGPYEIRFEIGGVSVERVTGLASKPPVQGSGQ